MTLSLVFCTTTFASEQVTLSTIEYPPFNQSEVLPNGGRGVLIDLVAEAFTAANVSVTFEFIPMARVVWSVVKKNHAATLGMEEWFAKENKEHLVETVELLNMNIVVFYKKDRFPEGLSYEHLRDLKSYTVGIVRGSSLIPLLEEAGVHVEPVSQIDQNFKKLSAGRLDLVVAVDLGGWTILRDLYPDFVDNFSTVKKPLLVNPAGLIFLKEHDRLIQTFRKGLGIILKNGTYYEILERYYGKDVAFDVIVPHGAYTRMLKKQ